MKDLTLVILAAGMGSRFGGLKQIEPVGPNGEFIIDYSIHDAIKAGFNKIIFVIKEENYELFKTTVGKRVEDKIEVDYVFQDQNNVPSFVEIPKNRLKPWGTAHAIYCAKDKINGPFAVITADDFYGQESFKILSESLKNSDDFIVIGYEILKTMSENGSVKRGICFEENSYITDLIESKVELIADEIICEALESKKTFKVSKTTPAFMLMVGLNQSVYEYLKEDINLFFKRNNNNLETCEYLLPTVINDMIKKKKTKVKLLSTPSTWMGITYKEDLAKLKDFINKKIEEGIYPSNLY